MTDPSFAQGLVGITLDGRYRLDAVLGEGGMGAVFRATQLATDRKVAVKLLKPHLTSDQAALQRFAREARATQKVDSPHAVKVLDFGVTPHADYYMVLEYLDGRTVQKELEVDGPFAAARVARIARHALAALGVAHTSGLVHRDVKPDNLLLMRVGGDPDYTKILDFGVAKLMQSGTADQLALTAAGMVFGTPEFMSPEQACGQPLDGRSDLYSLAATMFVMLTGQGLFEGKSAIEWLTHHARTPAPRLAMVVPGLAAYPELDDILQRCLAKSRDHRPASAAALAAMLAQIEPALLRAPGAAPAQVAITDRPTPEPIALGPTPPARPQASSTARRAMFQSSSFFRALTDADLAAIGTAGTEPVDTLSAAASSAELPPQAVRSRRGLYLGLGAAVIVAAIGLAFAMLARRGAPGADTITDSRTGSITERVARPAIADATPATGSATDVGALAATSGIDAGIAEAAAGDHAPADAAIAAVVRPTQGPGPGSGAPVRPGTAARNPEAEAHLNAAEDARRASNMLKQLVEAELALKAEPKNARAKFLRADALVKSGDLDNGCPALDALKRMPSARASAHAAGCPGD